MSCYTAGHLPSGSMRATRVRSKFVRIDPVYRYHVNPAYVTRLRRTSHSGTWYRAVTPHLVERAIITTHTRTIASRFSGASHSEPGFEILYLAENHLVAMFEVQALLGSPLSPTGIATYPSKSFSSIAISVQLTDVVDFTIPEEAELVSTNAQELTGDWRGYTQRNALTSVSGFTGKAPTQALGEHLYARCPEVKGFISISARVPYYRILGIFSKRLTPGFDRLQYTLGESEASKLIKFP